MLCKGFSEMELLHAKESVLFLGEGNFSFSLDLIKTWHKSDKDKIYATCFETDFVSELARQNAHELEDIGVKVMKNVDATQLHQDFKDVQFDQIIFMFPHIGGKMKIQKNRQLIKDFSLNLNAFLAPGGRVVVTLAGGQGGTPFDLVQRREPDTWQVNKMMAFGGFELADVQKFSDLIDKLKNYTSHGYRGWSQSFHTEKGIVHVYRKPVDQIKWSFTEKNPRERYLSEKLQLLNDPSCFIGKIWLQTLKRFKINPDSMSHCHLRCLDVSTDFDFASECPLQVLLSVDTNSIADDDDFVHRPSEPGSFTVEIDVMKTAEVRFRKRMASGDHYNWQLLWKRVRDDSDDCLSLYPPEYRHCLSFWLPGDYLSESDVLWAVLAAGNDCVQRCQIIDRYSRDGRNAITLEISYQSYKFPLSPSTVLLLQENSIGSYLASLGCDLK